MMRPGEASAWVWLAGLIALVVLPGGFGPLAGLIALLLGLWLKGD